MNIYTIISTLLMVGFGAISYYYRTKSQLSVSAGELVAEAEKKYAEFEKTGEQKLDYVVSILYSYIPVQFRWMFPEEVLKIIIENALSKMKEFAQVQIDKLNDKAEDAMEELVDKVSQ